MASQTTILSTEPPRSIEKNTRVVETSIANHTEADFYHNQGNDSIALGPKQPLESPKAMVGLKALQTLGCLVHVLDLSAGIAVFTSAQFKSQDTYTLYLVFLLINPVLLLLISLYTCVVAIPKMKKASQVHVDSTQVNAV